MSYQTTFFLSGEARLDSILDEIDLRWKLVPVTSTFDQRLYLDSSDWVLMDSGAILEGIFDGERLVLQVKSADKPGLGQGAITPGILARPDETEPERLKQLRDLLGSRTVGSYLEIDSQTIELRGIDSNGDHACNFVVKSEIQVTNPRTGEEVTLPSRIIVKAHPGEKRRVKRIADRIKRIRGLEKTRLNTIEAAIQTLRIRSLPRDEPFLPNADPAERSDAALRRVLGVIRARLSAEIRSLWISNDTSALFESQLLVERAFCLLTHFRGALGSDLVRSLNNAVWLHTSLDELCMWQQARSATYDFVPDPRALDAGDLQVISKLLRKGYSRSVASYQEAFEGPRYAQLVEQWTDVEFKPVAIFSGARNAAIPVRKLVTDRLKSMLKGLEPLDDGKLPAPGSGAAQRMDVSISNIRLILDTMKPILPKKRYRPLVKRFRRADEARRRLLALTQARAGIQSLKEASWVTEEEKAQTEQAVTFVLEEVGLREEAAREAYLAAARKLPLAKLVRQAVTESA